MGYKMSRTARREFGLCNSCSVASLPGRSLCGIHMAEAILRRKLAYGKKKSLGKCMKCVDSPAEPNMSLCKMHLHRAKVAISERNRLLKLETFNAYGGPYCSCIGCPQRQYSMLTMLTIDHINGGGNKHRKSILQDRGGVSFYRWLKRNGYPSGYQVLCWNCNLSKRYAPCEHISSPAAS